jgi:uncharacterized membrane protein YccC
MGRFRVIWPLSPAWSYALRNTIAALIALYIAYYLQLDQPYSAATTVFILASPLQGMVLSKALYRALGTIAGVVASLALVALFAQTPVLFMIGFSLWLGVCTALATMLRYFRSYGAVLAGYTVSLIAFGAVEHPEQIFDLATARLAVVMVGVVISTGLAVLTTPGGDNGRRRLQKQMRKVAQDMVDFAAEALRGDEIPPALIRRRRGIVASINALDPLIEAAGSESIATSRHVHTLRALAARFYEIMIIVTAIQERLVAMGGSEAPELRQIAHDTAQLLARYKTLSEAAFAAEAETLRALCQDITQRLAGRDGKAGLVCLVSLDRLQELLERLPGILRGVEGMTEMPADPATLPIRFHTDARQAVINGVRAGVAVLLAYIFWYYTAWSAGGLMFGALAPVCAFLATSDNPEQGSVGFLKGIALGAVVAFFYVFYVMPQIAGFSLLALTLAPIFLIASYITTKPKHALVATAFLIFGNTFIGARNPMSYDVLAFLNSCTAIIVGTAFAVLAFRLILPVDPRRLLYRLRDAMRSDLEAMAAASLPEFASVQHRMHDRTVKMLALTGIAPAEHETMLAGGRGAMRIGYEIGRARMLLDSLALPPNVAAELTRGFKALTHIRHDAETTAETLTEIAAELTEALASLPPGRVSAVARVTGAFNEISFLIDCYADFFKPRRRIDGPFPVAVAS